MKNAWEYEKAWKYIQHTEKDYVKWGFNNPLLGKELKRAVKDAWKWFGKPD